MDLYLSNIYKPGIWTTYADLLYFDGSCKLLLSAFLFLYRLRSAFRASSIIRLIKFGIAINAPGKVIVYFAFELLHLRHASHTAFSVLVVVRVSYVVASKESRLGFPLSERFRHQLI